MNRRVRLRLFLMVALPLLGLVTHSTYIGTGDEPHYLAIAHSLAFDFDLNLANNYGPAEPLIFDGGLEPGSHVIQGIGGIARPVHDIGMPLLLAPYVRVMVPLVSRSLPLISERTMRRLRLTPGTLYRHVLSAAMILLAAFLSLEMFEAFLALGASSRAAFWTATLVALSPPLLIFSALFFTELMSALLCLVVFRRLVLQQDGSPWQWGFAGAAAGLLLLVHVRNVGLVVALACLGVVALVQRREKHKLMLFLAPFATLLAVRTALNHHLWGTYILNPHARAGIWTGWRDSLDTAAVRLAGVLLDQEFGLLPYAPVFLIGIFGVLALWRTRRALLIQIGFAAGSYLLLVVIPIMNPHGWTGGWSPAARIMVPIVPLLALGVVAGLQTIPRGLLVMVIALQVGINAYFWQTPKNLWNDGDGIAAVCTRGGARFCRYLPSFVDHGS